MSAGNMILEKVIGTDDQIKILFKILKKRTHNISHITLPSIAEHLKFVRHHPYRAWYLIKIGYSYVGSAYLMKNNCIGVNLISNADLLPYVLKIILKRHKPLKEIKSIRPPYFHINVSPENKEIEYQLVKLNAKKIQSTFSVPTQL